MKSTSDVVGLYIDGKKQDDERLVTPYYKAGASMRIGMARYGGENDGAYHLKGKLDDIRLYIRVLSKEEIKGMCNDYFSFEMNLPAGWSMISLPAIPESTSVSTLFPEARVVYGYEKGIGYVRVSKNENLEVGKGYWILLEQEQSYTLTGQPIRSYTNTVPESGWKMIGGCSSLAQVSSNHCNIGVIYKYVQGAGYQRVTGHLEPGEGYWILLKDVTDPASLRVQ